MILDSRNEFADSVALNTGAAGTYLIGSQIDLTAGLAIGDNTKAYPGNSDGLYLVIIADVQADSAGGAATATFKLVSDAQAAIATDGSATPHFATAAIPELTLAPGYQVCCIELPRGTYERYLGLLQTTAGEAFTAGKISAFLTCDPRTRTPIAAPDAI